MPATPDLCGFFRIVWPCGLWLITGLFSFLTHLETKRKSLRRTAKNFFLHKPSLWEKESQSEKRRKVKSLKSSFALLFTSSSHSLSREKKILPKSPIDVNKLGQKLGKKVAEYFLNRPISFSEYFPLKSNGNFCLSRFGFECETETEEGRKGGGGENGKGWGGKKKKNGEDVNVRKKTAVDVTGF